MKTPSALFAAFALLAIAPAQDQEKAAPFRFVPADAQFVLRVAAPAQWQHAFTGTKVAGLFGSEAFAPWIAQFKAGYDEGLEAVRAEGKVDADLLQRFIGDYRGEMVVAAHLDLATVKAAIEADEPPGFCCSIAFVPDGKFDLAALCASMTKAAEEENSEELRDLVIGEHRLRAIDVENGVAATLPAMVDGHLVVMIGSDLATRGGKLLAADSRMAPEGDGAPLWMHADLRETMQLVMKLAAEESEKEGVPFDVTPMLLGLGLGAVESLSTHVKPNGERVEWDFAIGTAAANRGLFDIMSADPATAKLLRWLPAGVDAYSTTPFDFGALFRVVQEIWNNMGDSVPRSFDDAMAAFTESMKVRLKEDLLDHVGIGVLQLQDIEAAMDVAAIEDAAAENPFGAMLGGCYVFGLRDGKAFGNSLETLLRARGLHAARKSEDYQGTKIHRLRLAGVIELEYAVTDDLLLVASGSGEAPGQHLRGVLDTRAEGGAAELPAKVAPYVAALPKGWNGLSVSPVAQGMAALRGMLETLEQQGALPPEAANEQVLQVIGMLGTELERAGLGTMVGATYVAPRRLSMRLLW